MVEELLDLFGAGATLWGLLGLVVAAFAEYVFPPFPGDSFVLLGGVLVAARGWNPLLVVGAVTLGSLGGSLVDYWVGCWLRTHPQSWLGRRLRRRRLGLAIAKVVAGFERHGAVFLAINRFLPGVRAFFFVAAGMAGLSAWRVVVWGGASAIAWNVVVLGVGYTVGGNLERLEELFARYTTLAWVVVGLVGLVWLVRFLRGPGRAPPDAALD